MEEVIRTSHVMALDTVGGWEAFNRTHLLSFVSQSEVFSSVNLSKAQVTLVATLRLLLPENILFTAQM